jgi:small subunit ribosomal protein S6
MADQSPLYDLMLLLATDATDDQRTRILSSVESAISSAGGSIERNDDWGRRPMAYEIRHNPEAEYHLLQFRAPATLIEELSHTLRITDGVLRFRVIKVRPGTPAAKSSPPPIVAAVSSTPSGGSASSSERPSPRPSGGGESADGDAHVAEEEPQSGDLDSE